MSIYEHQSTFAGLPVVTFDPKDPEKIFTGAIRISTDNENFDAPTNQAPPLLDALASSPNKNEVSAIVVGPYGACYEMDTQAIVQWFVDNPTTFPKLRALFVGDITQEESEISWIQQSDITPILTALPDLEVLTVRGGEGLVVKPFTHQKLTSLTFQTGGLPKNVVQSIGESTIPALRHLEFWFGVQDYGGDTKVADLEPLLNSQSFPSLKSLGLGNSEFTNDFVATLTSAPVVQQLTRLDLSQGVLTDEHVQLLLESKSLEHLTSLNLTENYLSEDMVQKLQKLSFEVDASDQKEPDEWDGELGYYPSVTE